MCNECTPYSWSLHLCIKGIRLSIIMAQFMNEVGYNSKNNIEFDQVV